MIPPYVMVYHYGELVKVKRFYYIGDTKPSWFCTCCKANFTKRIVW